MPDLKGTQTEKNLLCSFAGESQARNRYTFAAKQASKDGHIQISKRDYVNSFVRLFIIRWGGIALDPLILGIRRYNACSNYDASYVLSFAKKREFPHSRKKTTMGSSTRSGDFDCPRCVAFLWC